MAQPGNLLSDNNESMETSVAGWGVSNSCTLAQSNTRAYIGSQSMLVTSTAATPAINFTSNAQTDQPQGLSPGVQYDVYCWVYTTLSSKQAWFSIDWRSAANAYLSTSDQTGSRVTLNANAWTLVQYKTQAAPASTAQATVVFNIQQAATSEQYWCDLFFFGTVRPKITQPPRWQPIVRSNFW